MPWSGMRDAAAVPIGRVAAMTGRDTSPNRVFAAPLGYEAIGEALLRGGFFAPLASAPEDQREGVALRFALTTAPVGEGGELIDLLPLFTSSRLLSDAFPGRQFLQPSVQTIGAIFPAEMICVVDLQSAWAAVLTVAQLQELYASGAPDSV